MHDPKTLNWFKKIQTRWNRGTLPVLMYHRVAVPEWDPWDLNVSPDVFENQIRYISEHYHAVSLPDELSGIQEKRLPIAVSFDDGYLDNYLTALPILKKHRVPATFFISSSRIGAQNGFWWDQLVSIFLQTENLPASGHCNIGSVDCQFDLGAEASVSTDQRMRLKNWKAGDAVNGPRLQAFLAVWKALKQTPQVDPYAITAAISQWAGVSHKPIPCLSPHHIREISEDPMFRIGVHTIHHPLLNTLPMSRQQTEIDGCKTVLENITGKEVRSFAAPYGGYNNDTLDLLRQMDFSMAFTTENKAATLSGIQTHPLEIPRIQATEQTRINQVHGA